jgi:transitional endoplasmic reticulum ATPase
MQLTVKQLKNREPGSGMAVIDRQALSDIGVSSGDFVAIEGRHGSRAVARVWPSDEHDAGRGIIRIDGQLRQAADVGIDDRVNVERTEVEPAQRVTVALPQTLRISGDLGSYVREELADQAVTPSQILALSVGLGMLSSRSGRRIPLQVVDTEPSGPVVVQSSTDVEILDQSSDEVAVSRGEDTTSLAEGTPAASVTYEDVGGLEDCLLPTSFTESCGTQIGA